MGLLYVTRHGETELNVLDKMQGSIDSPLTDKGIRQAEALGKRLMDVRLDRIYVSNLPRAIATAKITKGQRDLELIVDKGLAERDFGEWEGRVAEEIFKELGTTKQYAYTHPLEIEPKNGEKHLEYTKRVYDCFVRIAKENIYKDILIVTHGVTIKVITKILANKIITDPDDLLDQIPQASITLGKYDDKGFELLYRNDVKHLEER